MRIFLVGCLAGLRSCLRGFAPLPLPGTPPRSVAGCSIRKAEPPLPPLLFQRDRRPPVTGVPDSVFVSELDKAHDGRTEG